ncbi:hypothetical protein HPULCUR_002213 [Helicostylum pulchrum]|uniref:Uncharacterized protein n=1 Tax=Helicostylum pulchrum TaxID=562976 RepID=A0ABP9XRD1_9FUNG
MPTSRMQNPRVTKESHNVNDFFFAKIDNTVDNSLPVEIIEEYNNNMKEQANNYCFRKLPVCVDFLRLAISQSVSELPRWVW